MNNSGNQIRDKMIQQNPKTDRAKLVGIRSMLSEYHNKMSVTLEPFMLFTKGEDEYQGWHESLFQEQVEQFLVHPPDIVLRFRYNGRNRELFFELDGSIHDTKRTEKTIKRNKLYELNDLDYIVINEADLRFSLEIPKSRPLTQEQINSEFTRKLQIYLDKCLHA